MEEWRGTFRPEDLRVKLAEEALGARPTPQTEERRRYVRSLSDPEQTAREHVDRVTRAMQRNFDPIVIEDRSGGQIAFELIGDLEAETPPDPRDFGEIQRTLENGSTYGSRIRGTFRVVKRTADGKEKELDRKKLTITRVPTPIFDRSYVMDGKKRHLANQFRRKPGVFTRQDEKGDFVTEFNLDPFTSARVPNFKVWLDRATKDQAPEFRMQIRSAKKIPMWDVARLLGADESDLRKAVGSDDAKAIIARSSDKRYERTVRRLYGIVTKDRARANDLDTPLSDLENELRDRFALTGIDQEIAAKTLGVSSDRVSSEVVLRSFKKLIQVADEEVPPDDRESLAVKKVMSPSDLMAESVGRDKHVREFRRGVRNSLQRLNRQQAIEKANVRQLLGGQLHNKVQSSLKSGMLQRTDTATNPLDNWASASLTTIMGEGAIASDLAVPMEAKLINPSHLAILDPAQTAESGRAGVNLHLSSRARIRYKEGSETDRDPGHSEVVTTVLDRRGREVELTPAEISEATVGAFDQYDMHRGKPKPRKSDGGTVRAFQNGRPVEVSAREVQYWLPDSTSLFTPATSLIPFQNSTQGNRAQYSDMQTRQAVPLVHREEPLVQVKPKGAERSLEELMGEEAGAIVAPFDGRVRRITQRKGKPVLELEDRGGKRRATIPIADNFPMGGHTPLTHELRVEKGQEFKRGDVLADSTFTKGGKLALGVNLRTAYLPWHSSTFEDAITVSERAAEKLTSTHLYDEGDESDLLDVGRKHYNMRGSPLTEREDEILDEDGVVQVGTIVRPGEALLVGAKNIELDEDLLKMLAKQGRMGTASKRQVQGAVHAHRVDWKGSVPGEVVSVKKIRKGDRIIGVDVKVKTVEPLKEGDKLYGRHGNKGVVARVIPNAEAPRVAGKVEITNPGNSGLIVGQEISEEKAEQLKAMDSKIEYVPAVVDILLNPAGVAGRLNPSQNFETFLAKLARQKGKPELVENFGYESNWQYVKDRLGADGVPDGEDIYDPASGRTIQNVGVGTQYILKAKQTAEQKWKARGQGVFQKSGLASKHKEGAGSWGELGMYGLIAQNAREVLKDAQINKSENREEVWEAIRSGDPLPVITHDQFLTVGPERRPSALGRFFNYMRAAGVSPVHDAENSRYVLKPLTDQDVEQLAETYVGVGKKEPNVLEKPWETVRAKDNSLLKGGLFDEDKTGGLNGNKWARFELNQKMPNPMFELAIRDLLGVRKSQFARIMEGTEAVEIEGEKYYGARAFEEMLSRVDLDRVERDAKVEAATADDDADRSRGYRRLRIARMLKDNEMSPVDAFMRKQVAVLPTNMRPLDIDKDDNYVVGDINYLYRDVAMVNREIDRARKRGLPPKAIGHLESGLYETMRTLLQVEGADAPSSGDFRGILGVLSGKKFQGGKEEGDPKQSLFRQEVVNRRQAFSARAVLAADDKLGLDQAAIPYQMGAALMELDIQREWNRRNPSATPEEKQEFLQQLQSYYQLGEESRDVETLLEDVVRKKNVIVKRDPVLHKYGVQAFEPILTRKKTLGLNPLVFGGYNADSDGDTLAVFMPLSEEANREAKEKLRPSKNLFNPSNGGLEYTLGHEAVLGLARATRDPKRSANRTFSSFREAEEAYRAQEIDIDQSFELSDKDGTRVTTLGRERFSRALPAGMSFDALKEQGVFSDEDLRLGLGKGALRDVLSKIAVENQNAFGESANSLRQFGQEQATFTGASLIMDDLKPLLVKERRDAQTFLNRRIQEIRGDRRKDPAEREEETKNAFNDAISELANRSESEWRKQLNQKRRNTITEMVFSGARADRRQLKQLNVAPVALIDGNNNLVDVPVLKNYGEGLDVAGYWASMQGARQGAVSKVVTVSDPGYLTKQVVNTAMDVVVSEKDCGTRDGTSLDANRKGAERDLAGRVLSKPLKVGSFSLPAGTVLTADHATEIKRKVRGNKPLNIKIRSPLTCEADGGVCQKCAGYDPAGQPPSIGENIGIQAAQSMGERSTQLMLSAFHHGGVYQPDGGGAADLFERAQALLRMPSRMAGKPAVIAEGNGTVKEVRRNKNKGGWDVITKEDDAPNFFIPRQSKAPDGKPVTNFFTPGHKIKRGDVLTNDLANPKELLEKTGDMNKVQDYMVDRLHNLFQKEGVVRRNVETVVRSITGTVEVKDPGGSSFLPGQRITSQQAKKEKKKFKNLSFRPILKGVDTAPREMREDFLAKLNYDHLKQTLVHSATIGAESKYHGFHPIPALAIATEMNQAPPDLARRGAY